MDNSGGAAMGGAMLIVMLVMYFIPAGIAFSRGRENSGLIFLLNLVLGWTVIGWLVMLIVAFTGESSSQRYARELHLHELRRIANSAQANPSPPPKIPDVPHPNPPTLGEDIRSAISDIKGMIKRR